jgi:hypothetical protein
MTRREVTQTAAFTHAEQGGFPAPLAGDATRGKAVLPTRCVTARTGRGGGYMGRTWRHRLAEAPAIRSRSSPRSIAGRIVCLSTITMPDGRKIVGELLSEDTFTVLVQDLAGNNHAISKIRRRRL